MAGCCIDRYSFPPFCCCQRDLMRISHLANLILLGMGALESGVKKKMGSYFHTAFYQSFFLCSYKIITTK